MKIGVSFPTTEVGNDPIVMRDFAQAAEDMGYEYLTAIDHVLQARDPAGDDFRAYYTIDNAFHEPLILFSYLAGVTSKIGFVTAILILPQRPTVLVLLGGQVRPPAELPRALRPQLAPHRPRSGCVDPAGLCLLVQGAGDGQLWGGAVGPMP